MSNSVQYGSFNFSSLSNGVNPFVGVSDEQVIVGGRFRTLKRITIQGRIIPSEFCPNSVDVSSKIKTLLDNLKDDFLSINAGGISSQNARCESIEINQSNFFGSADYTANFIAYPESLSAIGFNILDPVDNRQIRENPDGTISITRTISARGVGLNGISEARDFINSVTPQKDQVPPVLLLIGNIVNANGLKPRRMVETINRMEGVVSLDVEFIYRATVPSNSIILSRTTDISYDEKTGFFIVKISGNLTVNDITSGWSSIKSDLYTSLNKIDFYKLALDALKQTSNGNFLNKELESFSTTEDSLNNSLNFDYTFTSDPNDVKNDISYQINYDVIKDITTVNVNGTITARGAEKNRSDKLSKAYNNLNLYKLANSFFESFAESKKVKLNSNPVNSNVTYNQYENTITSISFSSEFSNQFEENGSIIKFEYSLSCNPSINVYSPVQFLNGSNGVFDMKFFKRGTVSIQGTALSKSPGIGGTVHTLALSKLDDFISSIGGTNEVITESNVTSQKESDNGYNYSFSIQKNIETKIYE